MQSPTFVYVAGGSLLLLLGLFFVVFSGKDKIVRNAGTSFSILGGFFLTLGLLEWVFGTVIAGLITMVLLVLLLILYLKKNPNPPNPFS